MYEKYARTLYNYGYKIAQNRQLTEDCLQDLFLTILETRERLSHTDSGMPAILWIVGLAGSMLIVGYTATFPHTRLNVAMIGGISLALGFVFLFILIVDRPFMGNFSVSNAEMVGLAQKFDLLDRLSARSGP